ncbi:acyltransferase [Shigella sonnei]|jgi:peptidoglycan/LPS O-acetylase OafA/YrhL|nr:acyltransferase [Escherichia coli]
MSKYPPPFQKTAQIKESNFRKDINGLRAWAVLAVVLYHFGVPGFSGGFVGVDMFFVISGFLMTKIIITGLEKGDFSICKFYLARTRRICPALFTLCVVLLVIGWLWLPNEDLKILSGHVITSLLFLSNIKFWRESGYFDISSHDKFLLHTWSLSVEWQFYILLPIICVFLWKKIGRAKTKTILISIGIISLSLSLYTSSKWPEAAFYLLPTRIWEMLAGGLTWWVTRKKTVKKTLEAYIEIIGFILIITAITTFNNNIKWPGYLATIPVLGAMLILFTNRQSSFLTNNPIAQYIGSSSYSIYLWHWPLVVLLTYSGEQKNPILIVISIFLSLIIGYISLKIIENPSRVFFGKISLRAQSISFSVIATCIILPATLIFWGVKHSYPIINRRLTPQINEISNASKDFNALRDSCFLGPKKGINSPHCKFGTGPEKIVVVGDSHANAIVTALPPAINGKAIELTYSGCATILGIKRDFHQCNEFAEKTINELNSKYKDLNVLIVNRSSLYIKGSNEEDNDHGVPTAYFNKKYSKPNNQLNTEYRSALIKTMCSIKNPSRVYLLRPIPEMGVNVPQKMVRALMFGKKIPEISISLDEYNYRHQVVLEAQDAASKKCGVNILDPIPYLCHDGRCWGSKNNIPLYYDDDHLSEHGNKILIPMFEKAFANKKNNTK